MTEVIIDVEWEEIPNMPEIKESKVVKAKVNKMDVIVYSLLTCEILYVLIRMMIGFYFNYVFWSTHGGATLHNIVFGMP